MSTAQYRSMAVEQGDHAAETPLTAVEKNNTVQRNDNTLGLLDRLGNLHRFFCHSSPYPL